VETTLSFFSLSISPDYPSLPLSLIVLSSLSLSLPLICLSHLKEEERPVVETALSFPRLFSTTLPLTYLLSLCPSLSASPTSSHCPLPLTSPVFFSSARRDLC
jgi:hypothetical protein